MTELRFELADGSVQQIVVTRLLNGGYAGRSQADVAAHVVELAELGVAAPTTVPAVYPIAPYLASQVESVPVQHGRTSGEAEWAIVIMGPNPEDVLITVACDHTDRALEVHGVAWSKNASLDVLGRRAWRLVDVADHLDELRLRAWVTSDDGTERLIQDSGLDELLPPQYWLDTFSDLLVPGTVLLSGTVPMVADVDQFASRWRVQLSDPRLDAELEVAYRVEIAPEPVE